MPKTESHSFFNFFTAFEKTLLFLDELFLSTIFRDFALVSLLVEESDFISEVFSLADLVFTLVDTFIFGDICFVDVSVFAEYAVSEKIRINTIDHV